MILGLGTDLIAVARIRSVYQRHGSRFLDRVFTAEEATYCLAATDPCERLAARWAAKEACMKALGTGWASGVQFRHIGINRSDDGAPHLVLHAGAAARAEALGVRTSHVSLSHADGMAMATVILEG
ncbi:MAG: holo-ACP synthase [Planctomycetota bacterium]|nr:holo-ACP synthase [Planctomycetota bacterium]